MNAFKLTPQDFRNAIAQFLVDEEKMDYLEGGNIDLIATEDGGLDVLVYPGLPN